MTTITTRNNKNSELTYTEGDNNFSRDLKTAVADPAPIDITDNRTTYECTGTFDFTLVAASTLIQPTALAYADDFEITIKNVGTGVITVKTTGDTLDGVAATGDQAIEANESFTYKVNDAVDGWISTAKVSANALNSTAVITDDALVKGAGGARGVQTTGIIVADTSNNVTNMGTLSCGAITSASISGTSATVTGAVQAAITTCSNLTEVGILTAGDATGIVDAATLTAAGKVELATVSETNTGTDATIAVTPDGLDGWTGSAQVTTVGIVGTGTWQSTDVGVAHGGTGASTAAAARTNLGISSLVAGVYDGAVLFSSFPVKTIPTGISSSSSPSITGNNRMYIPVDCVVSDLIVVVQDNTVNVAVNVYVSVDNTPSALTVQFAAATPGTQSDLVNEVAVSAGSYIRVDIDENVAAGSGQLVSGFNWTFAIR